jgi:hypothetical protein
MKHKLEKDLSKKEQALPLLNSLPSESPDQKVEAVNKQINFKANSQADIDMGPAPSLK